MELDEGPGKQEGQEEMAGDEADEEVDGEDGQGDATESAPQPFPEQPVTEGPEPELADGGSYCNAMRTKPASTASVLIIALHIPLFQGM